MQLTWLDSFLIATRAAQLALVILVVTVAARRWFAWQFSLRTLLIVTTVVAVLLGLTMAASRY